jgi:hypothetical protein
VVNQGRELIDSLSQPLLRAKVPYQRHHLSLNQEAVAVAGVVPGLIECQPDFGEGFLR